MGRMEKKVIKSCPIRVGIRAQVLKVIIRHLTLKLCLNPVPEGMVALTNRNGSDGKEGIGSGEGAVTKKLPYQSWDSNLGPHGDWGRQLTCKL